MRREPGLDLYRALCVVMMFGVHLTRLETDPQSALGPLAIAARLFRGLLWAEPFISAAFLFIAGYSLVKSRAAAPSLSEWLMRMGRRVLLLYLASVALFWGEYGWELPDLWLSSGILAVIAWAISLTGLALSSRNALFWLALMLAGVIGLARLLDQTGATITGLNAGPGGGVPLVGFTVVGAGVACLRRRGASLGWLTGAALLLSAMVLFSQEPWVTTRASLYRDRAGELAIALLFHPIPEGTVRVIFWNHTAAGALGLLGPILVGLAGSTALPDRWLTSWVAQPLVVLGRHALAAYLGHLLLLGLISLIGLVPRHAGWTLVGTVLLTALAAALAAGLERWRARRPSCHYCPPEARSWYGPRAK